MLSTRIPEVQEELWELMGQEEGRQGKGERWHLRASEGLVSDLLLCVLEKMTLVVLGFSPLAKGLTSIFHTHNPGAAAAGEGRGSRLQVCVQPLCLRCTLCETS